METNYWQDFSGGGKKKSNISISFMSKQSSNLGDFESKRHETDGEKQGEEARGRNNQEFSKDERENVNNKEKPPEPMGGGDSAGRNTPR